MFNHDAYHRRLDQVREGLLETVGKLPPAGRETWTRDVSFRYGKFLANNGLGQLMRVVEEFKGYDHVADKQKHREYCAAEMMSVVSTLHAASAMMRGAVLVADPIHAEATMFVCEEANGQAARAPAVAAAGSASIADDQSGKAEE